jgi:hypothetical protein
VELPGRGPAGRRGGQVEGVSGFCPRYRTCNRRGQSKDVLGGPEPLFRVRRSRRADSIGRFAQAAVRLSDKAVERRTRQMRTEATRGEVPKKSPSAARGSPVCHL